MVMCIFGNEGREEGKFEFFGVYGKGDIFFLVRADSPSENRHRRQAHRRRRWWFRGPRPGWARWALLRPTVSEDNVSCMLVPLYVIDIGVMRGEMRAGIPS